MKKTIKKVVSLMLSAFLTLSMVHHYGYVAYAEEESGSQPEVTTVEEVTTEVSNEESKVVEVATETANTEAVNAEATNTERTVNPEESLPTTENTVKNQPVEVKSWTIDATTQKGEEVLEMQDQWIHFKSS